MVKCWVCAKIQLMLPIVSEKSQTRGILLHCATMGDISFYLFAIPALSRLISTVLIYCEKSQTRGFFA